jgi:hypothetical protein
MISPPYIALTWTINLSEDNIRCRHHWRQPSQHTVRIILALDFCSFCASAAGESLRKHTVTQVTTSIVLIYTYLVRPFSH